MKVGIRVVDYEIRIRLLGKNLIEVVIEVLGKIANVEEMLRRNDDLATVAAKRKAIGSERELNVVPVTDAR
jgi:hypothetical protein